MRYLYLIVIVSLAFQGFCQNHYLSWVKQIGGSGNDFGSDLTVTNTAVYSVGTFENVATFDTSGSNITLSSSGQKDIYIQKLDFAGNSLWTKQIGGVYSDYVTSICHDDSSNLIITGSFRDTVDFDPGIGTHYLNTTINSTFFILKLDSNGNFLWVKQLTNIDSNADSDLAVDNHGNIFITGTFYGTKDLNPGAGIHNLHSLGSKDIFLLKLNSFGSFIWAKSIGGLLSDVVYGIDIDITNKLYITGNFRGTVDFDPDTSQYPITSVGVSDLYILKLTNDGNFIWVKQIFSSGDIFPSEITCDLSSGNIYTAGVFTDSVNFNNASNGYVLQSLDNRDGFVLKLDSNGNNVWLKQFGGTGQDNIGSIAVSPMSNDLYIVGNFESELIFDPSGSSDSISAFGIADIYLANLSANGSFKSLYHFAGSGWDAASSVIVDHTSNIYTTGSFSQTVDFDPNNSVFNLSSYGSYDTYIQMISTSALNILKSKINNKIDIFPNPNNGVFQIRMANEFKSLQVNIFSIEGQLLESKSFHNLSRIELKINYPNGVYLVETVNSFGVKSVHRVVKQ